MYTNFNCDDASCLIEMLKCAAGPIRSQSMDFVVAYPLRARPTLGLGGQSGRTVPITLHAFQATLLLAKRRRIWTQTGTAHPTSQQRHNRKEKEKTLPHLSEALPSSWPCVILKSRTNPVGLVDGRMLPPFVIMLLCSPSSSIPLPPSSRARRGKSLTAWGSRGCPSCLR